MTSIVIIEPDELLEQVLEDERQGALEEFRAREESTLDTPQRSAQ